MDKILLKLFRSFIEGSGSLLNDFLMTLSDKVFYAEKDFTQALGSTTLMNFDKVYQLFLDFAISLIILKFIKKGFDIYIGWYDGDKDSDPALLITNFIKAIITALSFRYLYGFLADIVKKFMEQSLFSLLSLEVPENVAEAITNLAGNAIFWMVAGLVLVICYCILWIKFMVLGVEMLMLRIGFPLACIGLLDSDKGVFAPYMKKIFIICLTAVIQIFMLRLSLVLLGSGHLIWGLAFCFAAMKTPKTLNEFMFAYGGHGFSGAISMGHSVTSILSKVKHIKK